MYILFYSAKEIFIMQWQTQACNPDLTPASVYSIRLLKPKLQTFSLPHWKPCDLAPEPSFSQSSTEEQSVRLWSGKHQHVLATRLDFEAAQCPALNQRASLCSGLKKIYPSSEKHL